MPTEKYMPALGKLSAGNYRFGEMLETKATARNAGSVMDTIFVPISGQKKVTQPHVNAGTVNHPMHTEINSL
mgnify:CR=1 FL=1